MSLSDHWTALPRWLGAFWATLLRIVRSIRANRRPASVGGPQPERFSEKKFNGLSATLTSIVTDELDPEITKGVMAHIAATSLMDVRLTGLAASLATADFRTVSAMFDEVWSPPLRQKVLMRAAEASDRADAETMGLIKAGAARAKRVSKQRDKFAHHLWGCVSERPELLVLIEPGAVAASEASRMEFAQNPHDAPLELLDGWDRSRMSVYRSPLIQHLLKEAQETALDLWFLDLYVQTPQESPTRDLISQRLGMTE